MPFQKLAACLSGSRSFYRADWWHHLQLLPIGHWVPTFRPG